MDNEEQKNKEKRKSTRISTNRRARLSTQNREIFETVISDMSTGGAAIVVERPIPSGQKILLVFTLPHMSSPTDLKVEVICEVMNHTIVPKTGYTRMGLKFVQFNGEGLRAVKHFIDDRMGSISRNDREII